MRFLRSGRYAEMAMKGWLSVLLLAALLAAEVGATPPDGFRESVRLTPRARALSGNAAAIVYCAQNVAAYEAKVDELLGLQVRSPRAFAIPSENAAYFYSATCRTLEDWIRGRRVSFYTMGVDAHGFAHEMRHLAGVMNELNAECEALRNLAQTLRVHFAVKKAATIREMVAAARARNQRSSLACR